jgi:mRNA-degrading endonuclease toxin of MazEF toxin-antitoxin module
VANASMVMTYDRARIVSRAGRIAAGTFAKLDRALGVHLGLVEP